MKAEYMLEEKCSYIQSQIYWYRYMIFFSMCPCIKNYCKYLTKIKVKELKMLERQISKEDCDKSREIQREFTLEELSKYNGAEGMPAYIAVNGNVYDISLNPAWGGGTHFGLYAGQDLTNQFMDCHENNLEVLNCIPKIGKVKDAV